MSDRVQQAFGLTHPPFDKGVASDMLWMDQGREQALERLVDTVHHRQHALVEGESGVGKTCVQRALKDQLSPVHFRVQYVVHVTLGRPWSSTRANWYVEELLMGRGLQ